MNQPVRDIERAELPNGLVVVTERMPHVRSVSVGIWVGTGSRGESPESNGIAHFIEHMVFKGTERRTAEEIAQSMDSLGGMLDAFTAKEMTCFNAKVLDEHLPVAFDVLSDLVLRPRFDEADIAKEKQVVLEEIKMDEDNPESVIHEMFTQNFWRGHPLGLPILGTPETVPQFSRDTLLECFHSWYAPNNIVITAAGNLEHTRLVDMAASAFGGAARAAAVKAHTAPQAHATIEQRHKQELEQVHAEEPRRAKDHLKGSMMLSLESTSARISNLARQAMYFNRFLSLDEMLASIEIVTREEVLAIAHDFFEPGRLALTVLGNLKDFQVKPELLAYKS